MNKYTSSTSFSEIYGFDGKQKKIKTSTGEWEITYNGENRPIKFMSGNKRIEMSYDYMGRRVWLAYWINNAVDKERRYFYNEYLLTQEMKWDNTVLKEFTWDPTELTATNPLTMTVNTKGLNLLYTHDGNKNVSDVAFFASGNGIGAHYEYSVVSTSNSRITDVNIRAENPFRFSSEYHDDELGLIYYNYRHYNTMDGKWISRDPIEEQGGYNLYGFVKNNSVNLKDILGLYKLEPRGWFFGRPLPMVHIGSEITKKDIQVLEKAISQVKKRLEEILNDIDQQTAFLLNYNTKCDNMKNKILRNLLTLRLVLENTLSNINSKTEPLEVYKINIEGNDGSYWPSDSYMDDELRLPPSWFENPDLGLLLHELSHGGGANDEEINGDGAYLNAHNIQDLMKYSLDKSPRLPYRSDLSCLMNNDL